MYIGDSKVKVVEVAAVVASKLTCEGVNDILLNGKISLEG